MTETKVSNKMERNVQAKINIEEPSEQLLEWARNNIKEDPDTKDLLISELRDMIFERGECIPSRTDDDFLICFLRARHFIVKLAHRLFVNYHEFKEEVPDYFYNVNIKRLEDIAKKNIFNCPPNRDQLGRRMLIFKIGEWVPSEFTPTELIQFLIFLTQVTLLEPETQIKGTVIFIDLRGLSLEMVWYLTPTLARHLVTIAISSTPLRIEALHFINSTWIFDTAFTMIKSFIPSTVGDRIHFHNDFESLHESVDPKYLPECLGGNVEDFPLDHWINDTILLDNKVIDAMEKAGYGIKKFLAERKSLI